MLLLVLALAVSQADAPASVQPEWMPRTRQEPVVAPWAPPQAQASQPSILNRTLYTGLGAMAGSGAGLGISLALTSASPSIDVTFANAAVAAMLITGVAFTVHQTMGGRGEVTLALLASLAVMAGAAVAANAIDRTAPAAPILTTLIGTLPASAAAVLVLEATSPANRARPRVQVGLAPGGGYLGFTQSF